MLLYMTRCVLIGIIIFFVPLTAIAQIAEKPGGQEIHRLCGTPALTQEILEKAAVNTSLRNPDILRKPIAVPEWQRRSIAPVVGDSLEFWALNVKDLQYYKVMAELRAVGNLVYIWVEKSQLSDGTVQQSYINELLSRFETSTPAGSIDPSKGIIQIERELFGSEPNKDGDGKSDIFLLDIHDYFSMPSNPNYVSGFFLSNDQLNTSYSNRRDMLYLDTNPSISQNVLLTTAAHEYQHLIHYHYDQNETVLINEGASELVQYLVGLQWDDPSPFFKNTDRGLFEWADISDTAVLADYAKAQMWMTYLYDQFGSGFVRSLVQDPQHGIASIQNILAVRNTGFTFTDVLQNWFITNYINSTAINPAYGYTTTPAQTVRAQLLTTEKSYPAVRNNETLHPYAAEYIRLKNGLQLSGTFTSSFATACALNITINNYEVATVPVGVPYSDTQFGLIHKEVILTAMNETASSALYSYNFSASQLYFLRELQYDDGEPDIVESGQDGIWWGTQKLGFGWAVKFTTPNENSYLIGAKAYVVATVEMGIPHFLLKIYDSSGHNGLPGNVIIPPVPITLQSSLDYYWFEADLSAYEDSLSNYHGSFYISFEHSDTSGIYIGVDNSNPSNNYSYGLLGPSGLGTRSPGWYSMSTFKLGSTSMASYNLMIRAEVRCFESEPPIFTGGFLQNPIFSENFDVYVVGGKEISSNRLTATLQNGDSTRTLTLIPSGATNRVLVDNTVTISASGIISLHINGAYQYGVVIKDTTIQFSVLKVAPYQKATISTPSRRSSLVVPPNVVSKRTVFSAKDGVAIPMLIANELPQDDNSIPIGDAVTYGPASVSGQWFEIRFHINDQCINEESLQNLVIAKLTNDKWDVLPSIIDQTAGIITAYTPNLGTFQLRKVTNMIIALPQRYELLGNYPNPFNQQTVIRFTVPNSSPVTITIYDGLGRMVRELLLSHLPAGTHSVQWNGTDDKGKSVASGIYFYRMKAGSFVQIKRMIMIK